MIIESTPYSLQNNINSLKLKSNTIGFVPTMGALHQGHLSLIEASLQKTDKTIVSIFVNPTQFGKNEDFNAYPRNLKEDLMILQKYNIDFLFTPQTQDIYPNGEQPTVQIIEPNLASLYCGVSRPTHFQGVLGVVLRLFNIVQPDKTFLGEKDFQQLTLVKKMVKDLFLPIEIIGCPILREPSGLALSSRNTYLSEKEKAEAATIYQALCFAQKLVSLDEINADKVIDQVTRLIQKESTIQIDYMSIVDSETLAPAQEIKKNDRILFAGYLGKTRLIDNVAL